MAKEPPELHYWVRLPQTPAQAQAYREDHALDPAEPVRDRIGQHLEETLLGLGGGVWWGDPHVT
jgi:hypothetical protein